MGHCANFVVIENNAAQAYYDTWAGLGAAFAIADGPGPTVESLKAFAPTTTLLDWDLAEGGFLIDFDQSLVIVFGELEELFHEFADYDDEAGGEAGDEAGSNAERYRDYFTQIAPHWRGWCLRYDDSGVDAFAEHLKQRDIFSIDTPEPSHPKSRERFELVESR